MIIPTILLVNVMLPTAHKQTGQYMIPKPAS